MERITIYDTTLRDGSQGEGISFSVEDKLNITKKLDSFGVDYIEGGWPGSNMKDMEYFKLVQDLKLNHSRIAAFGSTRKPNTEAQDDPNLKAFIESGVKVVTIFGKTWDFHVTEALDTTLHENLEMITDSISFLKKHVEEVFFDCEHFFDGYKSNQEYALKTILAAQSAGADTIILCDTNGGALPYEVEEVIREISKYVKIPLGIHSHNDGGLGVANALFAVRGGARHVQGTINGVGERCGNGNLTSIIPNLKLKMKYNLLCSDSLLNLTDTATFINEICNIKLSNSAPFVGISAFAHKGGIHVSAVLKDPKTYEHISPESVGNARKVLVSELSGASNLRYKISELGIEFTDDRDKQRELVKKIKDLEFEGYHFEGAEASFELLLRRASRQYSPGFKLHSFHINTYKTGRLKVYSEASIKISVGSNEYHTAADGHGPVDAIYTAILKALGPFYPSLCELQVVDYKVRVIDAKQATSSKVRVLIEFKSHGLSWITIGVSHDIIEASWIALSDGISYKLMKDKQNDRLPELGN